jgi:hypothetical protein
MTAVANTVFTAAQFNTHVRDNLNQTAPAIATAPGQIFVATGVNSIAARTPTRARVETAETTGSASFTDLATVGPSVTVTTGTQALVIITAAINNNTATVASSASFSVSGATAFAADNTVRIARDGIAAGALVRYSAATLFSLTAGINTFTMKYSTQAATTATFSVREIIVIPF